MKTRPSAPRAGARAPGEGGSSSRQPVADLLQASPRVAAQRVRIDASFGSAAQLQPQAPNRTGLPDGLKSGIEALSGMDMSAVRVHHNSDRPAQLDALAYAQGSDIHLAPGQEQHLPHEAWHVVQQAQGRVRPTLQARGGVAVNDEAGLEREADAMGARAVVGVAQRIKTPVPRTFNYWHDLGGKDVLDHGKFFRAHLDTLYWQLREMKAQNTPAMTELNRLLALDNQALAQAEDQVVALIKSAPTSKLPSVYQVPAAQVLDESQQQSLAATIESACHLIGTIQGDAALLALVFGPFQGATAKTKFGEIARQIRGWGDSVGKEGPEVRVHLNTANAHYLAYCEGMRMGDKAKLMLGSKAFTDSRQALVGTLIHEASHGVLGTSDLAYIGNAVFGKLVGTGLSLENADHYKYAADIAARVVSVEEARAALQAQRQGHAVVGIEEALQQGAQLCAYTCAKVKRLVDWSIPLYQQRYAPHDVELLKVHDAQMDLGGQPRGTTVPHSDPALGDGYQATTMSEIAVARSETFAMALAAVNGFVSADKEIAVNGNVVTCKAKAQIWNGRTIAFDLGVVRDPVAVAKILFVTVLQSSGMRQAESLRLFDWHEALWNALIASPQRTSTYYQTAAEMQIYNILKG